MGAALRGGDGVAVAVVKTVGVFEPGDGPFGAAADEAGLGGGEFGFAGPDFGHGQGRLADILDQAVLEAAGEVEDGFGGNVAGFEEGWIAGPADADAAEQVGLGAAELVEAGRAEMVGAEDLGIRVEADRGAAAVMDGADVFEFGDGLAAGIGLAPQGAVTGDLDGQVVGQGVDDGAADAVQAAGGGVGLAAELAAGVERGEDDLEGAEVLELGVGVDGDAAAVVADEQVVAGVELDVDGGGVAGDGFVHGVVEDFGGEVVEGGVVGAADIHAGAAADGLEAFEDFDVVGGVGVAGGGDGGEQVVHGVFSRMATS